MNTARNDMNNLLYNDIDLLYFVQSRNNSINHKLFRFRAWEDLILKLYSGKCQSLNLNDLPSMGDVPCG